MLLATLPVAHTEAVQDAQQPASVMQNVISALIAAVTCKIYAMKVMIETT